MLVVVEGPDGSGKSTLIQALRRTPGQYCVIVQASRPRSKQDQWRYLDAISLMEELVRGPVICDRFHPISEYIYGNTLRGKKHSEQIVVSDCGVADLTVYCRPPIEVMRANLLSNPQMAGVAENLEALTAAYDLLMDHLGPLQSLVRYDYTEDSVNAITERVFT